MFDCKFILSPSVTETVSLFNWITGAVLSTTDTTTGTSLTILSFFTSNIISCSPRTDVSISFFTETISP